MPLLKRSFLNPRRVTRRALLSVGGAWGGFADWFNGLGLSENAILLGFAVAIGATAALGVVGFYRLIDLAFDGFWRWPIEHLPRIGFAAYRPMLTAVGFVVAWWIMRRFGRGNDGLTVPDVQAAVARRGGHIPVRPAIARTVASAVTLGSGGSAGAEGPVAVLGATVGSFLGRMFRFDVSRVRVLVAAGTAAGISAAFNAPLAGAFFALEEIVGSLAAGAFPPVIVSSVVAAVVSRAFLGNHPAFPIPAEYGYALQRELIVFYPLLGLLAGLVAVAFIRTYFGLGDLVRRLDAPAWALALVGGLSVGALVLLSNGLLVGNGHLAVHLEIFGLVPWHALALLGLGCMLATSITLNTGGSGGLFTPSLYIGAATGGAFGVGLAQLLPGLPIRPEAYALVGMGALVAAATGAPITGILLVFEMTNDYAIVLPLMLTTVIAHVVARRLEPDTLYSGWLRRRGERLEHGTDRTVLASLTVADAYDPSAETVPSVLPVADLIARLARGDAVDLPVLGPDRRLEGLIGVADLGRVAAEHKDLVATLVADDLAEPVEAVTPGDSLLEAVRRMGVRGTDTVPVVDDAGRFLGLVRRAHVLGLYERHLAGEAVQSSGSHTAPTRSRIP